MMPPSLRLERLRDLDVIERMAAALQRLGMPANEREAIRLLSANGYGIGDVAALAGEALTTARAAIHDRASAR